MPQNPYYIGPQTMSHNPSDYMQGIQSIGSSFSQGQQDFEANDMQQIRGAATSALQGGAAGFQIGGPVGAAVGAGVGLAANQIGKAVASNEFVKNTNTNVSAFSDVNGTPSYDYNAQTQAQQNADRLGAIGKRPSIVDLGVASISPIGIASQLLTDRKGARENQRQIEANIRNQQDRFNNSNTQYQQGLLQRQEYQNRLNNVYKIPMGYF